MKKKQNKLASEIRMEKNYKEFKTWAKWKQRIVISAKAANTGNYYEKETK